MIPPLQPPIVEVRGQQMSLASSLAGGNGEGPDALIQHKDCYGHASHQSLQ
jgi:hypothetical protein